MTLKRLILGKQVSMMWPTEKNQGPLLFVKGKNRIMWPNLIRKYFVLRVEL